MEATQERIAVERIRLDMERINRTHSRYRAFKRVQDVILSAAALAVLLPLMVILAAAVMIDSPGKPIFVQERVGKNGRIFRFYKFRTMVTNAEELLDGLMEQNEMEGPAFKIRNDPRITRVGRFLRRSSLDELPQLWNILRGDMSIVGPRPPLPREVALYDDYHLQRLYITPGLTCYWQIQNNRNDLSFDEWAAMDVKYIQEESFQTDWKIIFGTVGAVLGMNGI